MREREISLLSPGVLLDVERGRVVRFELFPDMQLEAVRVGVKGDVQAGTWRGRSDVLPDTSIVLTWVGRHVAGFISTPVGIFRIGESSAGTPVVQHVDLTLPHTEEPLDAAGIRDRIARPRPLSVEEGLNDPVSIDVAVLFTDRAMAAMGGPDAARAAAALMVETMNAVLLQSQVSPGVTLELVHAGLSPEAEPRPMPGVRLSPSVESVSRTSMKIRAITDRYAADFVTVVSEEYGAEAWIETPAGALGNCGDWTSVTTSGFAITIRRSCLGTLAFPHLVGDLFGLRHDPGGAGSLGATVPGGRGFVSLPGRFFDVAASPLACRGANLRCQQVALFSNPRIMVNGYPAGFEKPGEQTCVFGKPEECPADAAAVVPGLARFVADNYDRAWRGTIRVLNSGETTQSENGAFRLVHQPDGNLVIHRNDDNAVMWTSDSSSATPTTLELQEDGNLVLYDTARRAVWATATRIRPAYTGVFLTLGNDGRLRLYGRFDGLIWTSH